MPRISYNEKQINHDEDKIIGLLDDMPQIVIDYIASIQEKKTASTRLAYLRDIRTFLLFYRNYKPLYNSFAIKKLDASILSRVSSNEIAAYLEYLEEYTQDGKKRACTGAGKHRKLAALRAFLKYMVSRGLIKQNPARGISVSVDEAETKELSDNELSVILDEIMYGTHLSKRQHLFHDRIVKRDQAIVYLLASTGITVTELVSLNYGDLDLDTSCSVDSENHYVIRITRKTGRKEPINITQLCADYLRNYLDEREEFFPGRTKETDPFFISLQGFRISSNAVLDMLKRYTRITFPDKRINCKIFRTTRTMRLLRDAENPKVIADLMGHKEKTAIIYQKKRMKTDASSQTKITYS